MKKIQKDEFLYITLDAEDIDSLTELKLFLHNPYCVVKFSRAFVRAFYQKPVNKLDAPLKAPPCNQSQLVGAWFDTLFKLYIPLKYISGFGKPELTQFVSNFSPEGWFYRWLLVSSIFVTKSNTIKLDELTNRGQGWRFTGPSDLLRIVQEFLNRSKQLAELHEISGNKILGKPEFLQQDAVNDIINLINLIDEDVWQFHELYMAHQFIGGKSLDIVVDRNLIDIKASRNCVLRSDYFDQLVMYYLLFGIWQKMYPLPVGIVNYRIEHLGIYFARFGYLHYLCTLRTEYSQLGCNLLDG
jgi:hypothetical protein